MTEGKSVIDMLEEAAVEGALEKGLSKEERTSRIYARDASMLVFKALRNGEDDELAACGSALTHSLGLLAAMSVDESHYPELTEEIGKEIIRCDKLIKATLSQLELLSKAARGGIVITTDPSKAHAVTCIRVSDAKITAKDSRQEPCASCHNPVWVAPQSPADKMKLCIQCTLETINAEIH